MARDAVSPTALPPPRHALRSRNARLPRCAAARLGVAERLQLDLVLLVIARRRQRVPDERSHGAQSGGGDLSHSAAAPRSAQRPRITRSGALPCVGSVAGGGAAGQGQGRRASCHLCAHDGTRPAVLRPDAAPLLLHAAAWYGRNSTLRGVTHAIAIRPPCRAAAKQQSPSSEHASSEQRRRRGQAQAHGFSCHVSAAPQPPPVAMGGGAPRKKASRCAAP